MIQNLNHFVTYIILAVLLTAGGYAAGRWAQPAKVVVTEKLHVETVEKQVVVVQKETQVQVVRVTDTIRDQSTDTHTEKRPDGTVVTDTHVRTAAETKTDTDTNKDTKLATAKTLDLHQTTDQSKTTVTLTHDNPTWAFSLMPGFDVAGALGHGSPYSLFPNSLDGVPLQHFVLGVGVDRRLLGPLYTGVWANSAGMAGITLRLQF